MRLAKVSFKQLILCCLSIPEGCTDLVSCLEGARMTTEGVFIIEEAGLTATTVSFKSAFPHDL